jgi:hypothetical protein
VTIDTASLTGLVSDYNVVMNRFTTDDGDSIKTLAQWRSATGQDAHSIIATPAQLFVDAAGDDYHLAEASPAIDAGIAALGGKSAPAKDYEGDSRPMGDAFDVGADEAGVPTHVWTQTTATDFSAGQSTGLTITNTAGGEAQLADSGLFDNFDRTDVGPDWLVSSYVPPTGGTSSVSLFNGSLIIAASQVRSAQVVQPSAVEARVRFDYTRNQHFGLATDFSTPTGNSWAAFGTRDQLRTLFARVNVNGKLTDVSLGALPTGYHTYRVEPVATGVRFFIDSKLRASINKALPAAGLHAAFSAVNANRPLRVAWVHMPAYATTGTFTSSVFDAGQAATWVKASWSAALPTGASLTVETSSGDTPVPDDTWSSWSPVTNGGAIPSPGGRYIRYRVTFTTSNPAVTPVLADVSIEWM